MKESATFIANTIVRQREAHGLIVYNFGLGECPFKAPDVLVEKLREVVPFKDYTSTEGTQELKVQLLKHYKTKVFNPSITVVGNGLKPLLSVLFYYWQKRIVVFTPAWVSYLEQLKGFNKEYVAVPCASENNYKITSELIMKHCHKDDLVILTHPNNPTGAVYTKSELQALAVAFAKKDVVVLADEIYLRLAFNYAWSITEFYPKCIVGSSLSKEFGCGGWRCGWFVFPQQLAHHGKQLNIHASTFQGSPSHCMQLVAAYAITYPPEVNAHIQKMNTYFSRVCREIVALLQEVAKCTITEAAWYTFIDLNAHSELFKTRGLHTSEELSHRLINDIGFVAVPGGAFDYPGYTLRLSFISDENHMKQGIREFIKWLS